MHMQSAVVIWLDVLFGGCTANHRLDMFEGFLYLFHKIDMNFYNIPG